MKAIVYTKYGPPDVLQLKEVQKPAPGDDEVLVKIHAAAANPLDWHFMRAAPFIMRFFSGLLEAGHVVSVIDRVCPLSEIAEAIRYLEEGHARGKIVITIEHNNQTKQNDRP